MIDSSINTSFVSSKKKHGIGTPHERCREMHQSERPLTIGRIRFEPDSGMNLTESNAFNASSLNPSTEQNHCSVARKIVGFFVRQSYGYLCSYASLFNKALAAVNCSMHFSFPSPRTFKPTNSLLPASSEDRNRPPESVTVSYTSNRRRNRLGRVPALCAPIRYRHRWLCNRHQQSPGLLFLNGWV